VLGVGIGLKIEFYYGRLRDENLLKSSDFWVPRYGPGCEFEMVFLCGGVWGIALKIECYSERLRGKILYANVMCNVWVFVLGFEEF
jgi:hypothetical protein